MSAVSAVSECGVGYDVVGESLLAVVVQRWTLVYGEQQQVAGRLVNRGERGGRWGGSARAKRAGGMPGARGKAVGGTVGTR